jgi:hypothetical protein
MKSHNLQISLWKILIPQKYKKYNQYLKDGMSHEFAYRKAKEPNVVFKLKQTYTLEEIEDKVGFKLQYPFQTIDGNMDDEKYEELRHFGCSDIMDTTGNWLHRDCFIGRNKGACEQCNFFPVKQEYQIKNYITNDPEIDDLFKSMSI